LTTVIIGVESSLKILVSKLIYVQKSINYESIFVLLALLFLIIINFLFNFFLGFQKATLNYLAVLKVEICKIADNQQHIIQLLQSRNVNTQGDEFNWEHEVDYFIHNWPIYNKENLINMEEKINPMLILKNKLYAILICKKIKL